MGMLDYLINSNKEPKEDMEYVYLLDEVWKPGELGSHPIKFGSIVTNVTKSERFIIHLNKPKQR